MSVGQFVSAIYLRSIFQGCVIFSVDPTYSIWLTPAIALCDDVVEVVRLIVVDVGYFLFIHEWLLTRTRVNPLGAICIVPGCGKGRDVQRRTRKSSIILRPG